MNKMYVSMFVQIYFVCLNISKPPYHDYIAKYIHVNYTDTYNQTLLMN